MTVRRINLLPEEIVVRRRVRRQGYFLVGGFIVFLLILAAASLFRQLQISEQRDLLAVEQARVRTLEQQVAALQEFAELERSVVAKRTALGGSMAGDIAWSRLLIELSMVMPADSWLTSFSGTAGAAGTPAPPGAPPGAPVAGARLGTVNFVAVTRDDFLGVARFLTRLQELESLTNIFVPTATAAEISETPVVNYSSTADISSQAASGRYQSQAGAPAAPPGGGAP